MTLRKLIETHPEWADLPIAILCENGNHHYVTKGVAEDVPNCLGDVYESENEFNTAILVFAN
jgi:hypothetical protein